MYLSVHKVAVPAVARHDSGKSVRMSQHVSDGHLVKSGIPEGEDRGSSCAVASLVVMVVGKDNSIAVSHESPTFSPVPAHKNERQNVKIFKRTCVL